jgi:hypothetical protein
MIKSGEALCLFFLVVSLACARAPTPNSTGPAAEATELKKAAEAGARSNAAVPTPKTANSTGRQETPLTVRWMVMSRTEKSVTLTARVDRRAALSTPVKVAVVAPKGVTLAGGAAEFSISPSDGPSVTDTTYVLSFSEVPTEDIVLTADVSGSGFGVHATDVYRFGRPAPVVALPQPTGPHLQLGGQDLGASVPLKQ